MRISEMAVQAFCVAEDKGFHAGRTTDGRDDTLIRLGLIHTEVSEAMQEVKRHSVDNRATIGEELADILIRVGDLAVCLSIDLEAFVIAKIAKNKTRPHLFGTPQEKRAVVQRVLGTAEEEKPRPHHLGQAHAHDRGVSPAT